MSTEVVNISFTLEFKRNLRALSKKYRSIRADIQPLIDELILGELPGEQVPGVSLAVFKVRLKNRDMAEREAFRISLYLLPQDTK